ncbi:MAG TPA: DinB family protein [Candidatus Acidoferrum sp.]|nr:DinB family protein [Candidatus Acidoferrum sp.]
MSFSQSLIPEFDHEMKTSRTLLERIPEDKLAWKPHEKSMTLGRLAGHIAELPGFVVSIIQLDELDFAPKEGGPPRKPTVAESRQHVLEVFDAKAAAARPVIASASDEHLAKVWKLSSGGKTIFAMPRAQAVRAMFMNHVVHHRGQLSVYLRLLDVPVPSIYGPSADEGKF